MAGGIDGRLVRAPYDDCCDLRTPCRSLAGWPLVRLDTAAEWKSLAYRFTAYSDYYLQLLELVSILPALAVGYIVCRYFRKLATWAWILPTVILSYKLLTFTDPQSSVFISHPLSRFSYYFVIVRLTPTFTDLRGSDPIRLVQQMTVVAPFYSGVAYSIGALLESHKMLERIIRSIFRSLSPKCLGRSKREPSLPWMLTKNLSTKATKSHKRVIVETSPL
jgi:hypothetical protein